MDIRTAGGLYYVEAGDTKAVCRLLNRHRLSLDGRSVPFLNLDSFTDLCDLFTHEWKEDDNDTAYLESEVERLESELATEENAKDELEGELSDMADDLDKAERELVYKEEEIDDLKKQLRELTDDYADLERKYEETIE